MSNHTTHQLSPPRADAYPTSTPDMTPLPAEPRLTTPTQNSQQFGTTQPMPIDAYADSLIGEVFEELDQMLDETERVQMAIDPEDYRTGGQPMVNNEPAMPLAAMPTPTASGYRFQQQADVASAALQEPVLSPTSPPVTPATRRASRLTDRLMLVTAIASIIATAVVGWLNRQDIQQFVAVVTGQQPQTTATLTADPQVAADLQFINYVQRSLEVINSTAVKSNGLPVATNPNADLSSVAVNGNLAQPSTAPTVLERIYIPVYQPPQAFYMPPAAQLPAATTNPAQQPSSTAGIPAPSASPSPSFTETVTLVGILELGSKSAVLFEVNGAPQRIYPGESIGNSGWTLVKITGQEAVIRRNGEVRSVYVGQKL